MIKRYYPCIHTVCIFTDYVTPKNITNTAVVDYFVEYFLDTPIAYINSTNRYVWLYILPFDCLTEFLL